MVLWYPSEIYPFGGGVTTPFIPSVASPQRARLGMALCMAGAMGAARSARKDPAVP